MSTRGLDGVGRCPDHLAKPQLPVDAAKLAVFWRELRGTGDAAPSRMTPNICFEAIASDELSLITGGGSAAHAIRTAATWGGHGAALGALGGAFVGTLAAPFAGTVAGSAAGAIAGGLGGAFVGYAKGLFVDSDR